jgi:hypothetical protein
MKVLTTPETTEATPGTNVINWPTEEELQGVSEQLAQIRQEGIRSEAEGHYFKSGDLAYQIQEIIRATRALARRSERGQG